MTRLAKRILATGLLTAMAFPALAQTEDVPASATDPKINTVIIFGEDKCPESSDSQINVCAILVEADRYRIPAVLRDDINNPRKEAWTNRAIAYQYVGREGTMSCTPTGGGGFTGCGLREIDKAYAEKAEDPGLAFGQMIAAERKARLAQIDAEAEEVEKRVVQFEKERAAKEARDAGEQPEGQNPADSEALPQPK